MPQLSIGELVYELKVKDSSVAALKNRLESLERGLKMNLDIRFDGQKVTQGVAGVVQAVTKAQTTLMGAANSTAQSMAKVAATSDIAQAKIQKEHALTARIVEGTAAQMLKVGEQLAREEIATRVAAEGAKLSAIKATSNAAIQSLKEEVAIKRAVADAAKADSKGDQARISTERAASNQAVNIAQNEYKLKKVQYDQDFLAFKQANNAKNQLAQQNAAIQNNANQQVANSVKNLNSQITILVNNFRATGANAGGVIAQLQGLQQAALKAQTAVGLTTNQIAGFSSAAGRAASGINNIQNGFGRLGLAGQVANQVMQQLGSQFSAFGPLGNIIGSQLGNIAAQMNGMQLSAQNASGSLRGILGVAGLIAGGLAVMGIAALSTQLDTFATKAQRAEVAGKVFELTMSRYGLSLKDADKIVADLAGTFKIMPNVVQEAVTQMTRAGASIRQIQDLLKGGAASALAANKSAQEGFEGVTQALITGQSVWLNQIGISENILGANLAMSKSLGKSREDLTNQEKALALTNLVLKATREELSVVPLLLDGFAGATSRVKNAQEGLAIAIGQRVRPAMTDLKNSFAAILEGITAIVKNSQGVENAFVGIGTAATTLYLVLGWKGIAGTLTALPGIAAGMASKVIASLTAIGVAGAAMNIAVGGLLVVMAALVGYAGTIIADIMRINAGIADAERARQNLIKTNPTYAGVDAKVNAGIEINRLQKEIDKLNGRIAADKAIGLVDPKTLNLLQNEVNTLVKKRQIQQDIIDQQNKFQALRNSVGNVGTTIATEFSEPPKPVVKVNPDADFNELVARAKRYQEALNTALESGNAISIKKAQDQIEAFRKKAVLNDQALDVANSLISRERQAQEESERARQRAAVAAKALSERTATYNNQLIGLTATIRDNIKDGKLSEVSYLGFVRSFDAMTRSAKGAGVTLSVDLVNAYKAVIVEAKNVSIETEKLTAAQKKAREEAKQAAMERAAAAKIEANLERERLARINYGQKTDKQILNLTNMSDAQLKTLAVTARVQAQYGASTKAMELYSAVLAEVARREAIAAEQRQAVQDKIDLEEQAKQTAEMVKEIQDLNEASIDYLISLRELGDQYNVTADDAEIYLALLARKTELEKEATEAAENATKAVNERIAALEKLDLLDSRDRVANGNAGEEYLRQLNASFVEIEKLIADGKLDEASTKLIGLGETADKLGVRFGGLTGKFSDLSSKAAALTAQISGLNAAMLKGFQAGDTNSTVTQVENLQSQLKALKDGGASPEDLAAFITGTLVPALSSAQSRVPPYTTAWYILKGAIENANQALAKFNAEAESAKIGGDDRRSQQVIGGEIAASRQTIENALLGRGDVNAAYIIQEEITRLIVLQDQFKPYTKQWQDIALAISEASRALKTVQPDVLPGNPNSAGSNRSNDEKNFGVTLGLADIRGAFGDLNTALAEGTISQEDFALKAATLWERLEAIRNVLGEDKKLMEEFESVTDFGSDVMGLFANKAEDAAIALNEIGEETADAEVDVEAFAEAMKKADEETRKAAEAAKEAAEAVQKAREEFNSTATSIIGAASAAVTYVKAMSEIASSTEDAEDKMDKMKAATQGFMVTAADILGKAIGIPFLGEAMSLVMDLTNMISDAISSLFDPIGAKVKELSKQMRADLTSALSEGILGAIKAGTYFDLAKVVSSTVGEFLLKKLIETFVQSQIIEAIMKGPMDKLARAYLTDDPNDDAIAEKEFNAAVGRAKAVTDKAMPSFKAVADRYGVKDEEKETKKTKTPGQITLNGGLPSGSIQTAIGTDFRAGMVAFNETVTKLSLVADKMNSAADKFNVAADKLVLMVQNNGALRYE